MINNQLLTLCLLSIKWHFLSADNLQTVGSRLRPTKGRTLPGYKQFDIVIVFMKVWGILYLFQTDQVKPIIYEMVSIPKGSDFSRLHYLGLSEQQRRRPACASGQSDQCLCFSCFGKYHIQTCYKRNCNFLASPCVLISLCRKPWRQVFSRRGPFNLYTELSLWFWKQGS